MNIKPIKTEDDYNDALARIEALWDAVPNTKKGDELSVLAILVDARKPLEMEGGTVFHFVTGGIDEALMLAKDAAGAKDVRIGGGAATIRQYVEARLVDELHLVVSPVLLGSGEPLWAGLDLVALGYRVVETTMSKAALHVRLVGAGIEHP
jgi:dihydrofolate reductase